MKEEIQRHRKVSRQDRIYYISSEVPQVEYVSQEGPENTLSTKAIRKRLVIETWALLRSSILPVFHRLGLSVGDKQNLSFQ